MAKEPKKGVMYGLGPFSLCLELTLRCSQVLCHPVQWWLLGFPAVVAGGAEQQPDRSP